METFRNLYDELCSFQNLSLAFKKAIKNKRYNHDVAKFELNLENELLQLKHELKTMTYRPHPLKRFIIRDPKTRVISSSHFRDRVVHHALCNMIEPIFEKTFISDSYANRKGKGALKAVLKFDEYKRKVSGNGKLLPKAKDNNQVYGYALKADIRKYFDTVDHEVLMDIVRRKIKDEKVIWLIRRIMDNHNCKIPGKGMPIGNLTSQFFANVYLNELDYFIKHELKAKYYIRYVDDFVVLDSSEEKLEIYKEKISNFLKTLKLELHKNKSKVIPIHKGIKFLGYKTFYYYRLPKKSNSKRILYRIEDYTKMYAKGIIDKEKVFESFEGWKAYAMHGNTYKFRRKLTNKLNKSSKNFDK
ncbi:MAG: hypothetical protein ISS48_02835 [Candidatus Aenigmarchaeota archaeon]|nr:hypothetical protein [Candidatus Aenigmarchaeota archaeon]